ncbi:carboxypeptidase regulatory-like domain-containing protein [bacterium]|nr:carboxypeptidase regulatory-like domain-containing protein [bacterium]
MNSSGSNAANQTPSSTISGRVLGETGGPVAGVQVIVHERTTDLRTSVRSGPNGEFQLTIAQGVYDLGLEAKTDATKANSFYGPITVTSPVQQDFVIRNTSGHTTDEVFGKIWLTPGVPAANRQITLRPGAQLRGTGLDRPASPSTRTNPDGTFSLPLGSNLETALDVEIYDSSGLDEWVDVSKRAKACYVEFTSEDSPVENRLRCTELDPSTSNLTGTLGAPSINPFATRKNKGVNYAILEDGLIPVGAANALLSENMLGGPLDDTPLWKMTKHTNIQVINGSKWGYEHSIIIKPDRSSDWAFTDETNDSYQLWVSITLWSHVVGYDSVAPNIKRIDFDLSKI